MEYFKFLPVEIKLDILTRLPTETVLECKLVCTNWRSLVSHHRSFAKMHLDRLNDSDVASGESGKLGFLAITHNFDVNQTFQYFEYDEKNHESTPIQNIRRLNLTSPFGHHSFVNSCNGLVCLAEGRSVYICNPISREFILLPKVKKFPRDTSLIRLWSHGFGYVYSTNEYKVVVICESKNHVDVHIYILGSGSGWRHLGNFNFGPNSSLNWGKGVFANGTLYFMDIGLKTIITFDLAKEKFSEQLSPPILPPDGVWCLSKLGVLDGYLAFAAHLNVARGRYEDIYYETWLLKRKNGDHDKKEGEEHQPLVWSKEFRIYNSNSFAITKRNAVLTYSGQYLDIHDIKTATTKMLVKFKSYFYQVCSHKNTLVSLKQLGEEDTKRMESVESEETESCDYPSK